MSRIATAYETLRDDGLGGLSRELAEYCLREPRLSRDAHRRLARAYYGSHTRADRAAYDAPFDPFSIEWVDPRRIERHTRRRYPPYKDREYRFGAVEGGDWDRRERPPVDPEYDGAPADLFVADRFAESTLYRSFEVRFEEGAAWTDTPLYEEACRLLETAPWRRHVWHGCASEAELFERFDRLDALYASISENGVESAYERLDGDPDASFREWVRAEIAVDVGRDGELFLVCGKHRFSCARLAGLRWIPVLFLVRHPEWMAHRDRMYRGAVDGGDHPDLRGL
ncbi:MAG: hypothetical protein QXG03_04030 [Halalkalicoccus sp.]